MSWRFGCQLMELLQGMQGVHGGSQAWGGLGTGYGFLSSFLPASTIVHYKVKSWMCWCQGPKSQVAQDSQCPLSLGDKTMPSLDYFCWVCRLPVLPLIWLVFDVSLFSLLWLCRLLFYLFNNSPISCKPCIILMLHLRINLMPPQRCRWL